MATVSLDATYIEILGSLGSIEDNLARAVHRYAIEQVGERVGQFQKEVSRFQSRYGLSYDRFCERISEDEEFVLSLRTISPTWERDLNSWEYYVKELAEWLGRLERISTN